MSYQPKTGARCLCRRGMERDNCPACEGTGWRIDFAAIHARAAARTLPARTWLRGGAMTRLRRICHLLLGLCCGVALAALWHALRRL
jgi:hypothetical protein